MVHLTEKPVELAVRAMQYSSRPGENVLDLFGGSGSTLIAAEQTGRHAFLMELDPLVLRRDRPALGEVHRAESRTCISGGSMTALFCDVRNVSAKLRDVPYMLGKRRRGEHVGQSLVGCQEYFLGLHRQCKVKAVIDGSVGLDSKFQRRLNEVPSRSELDGRSHDFREYFVCIGSSQIVAANVLPQDVAGLSQQQVRRQEFIGLLDRERDFATRPR